MNSGTLAGLPAAVGPVGLTPTGKQWDSQSSPETTAEPKDRHNWREKADLRRKLEQVCGSVGTPFYRRSIPGAPPFPPMLRIRKSLLAQILHFLARNRRIETR